MVLSGWWFEPRLSLRTRLSSSHGCPRTQAGGTSERTETAPGFGSGAMWRTGNRWRGGDSGRWRCRGHRTGAVAAVMGLGTEAGHAGEPAAVADDCADDGAAAGGRAAVVFSLSVDGPAAALTHGISGAPVLRSGPTSLEMTT